MSMRRCSAILSSLSPSLLFFPNPFLPLFFFPFLPPCSHTRSEGRNWTLPPPLKQIELWRSPPFSLPVEDYGPLFLFFSPFFFLPPGECSCRSPSFKRPPCSFFFFLSVPKKENGLHPPPLPSYGCWRRFSLFFWSNEQGVGLRLSSSPFLPEVFLILSFLPFFP